MICVVGSSNTDLVVRSQTLPKPGETVLGGEFQRFPGGKGANQAVAAARVGGHVSFVAALGEDDFGREALANFQREGINTRHVNLLPEVASGIALILVDARGENLISVASGANLLLSPEMVSAAEGSIAEAALLLMQMEIPLESVREAAALARKHRTKVLLNPAPCPAGGLPDALLAQVDILIPNALECRQLGRQERLEDAAKALLARGVGAVIVTQGADGVTLFDGKNALSFAAPHVQAVDTVGAGDCFCGLLAVALDEGKSLEESIRFAMAGAALSVTRHGAQTSFPRRDEIRSVAG